MERDKLKREKREKEGHSYKICKYLRERACSVPEAGAFLSARLLAPRGQESRRVYPLHTAQALSKYL